MKLITAVVQPHQLMRIQAALIEAGAGGATVSGASGIGRQKGLTEHYRGREYNAAMVPKIKVETVVADSDVEVVLDAIINAARTGNIGDGKVWVTAVEEVVRVRTGETGDTAI